MFIRIYQINADKDINHNMFMNFDLNKFDASSYDCVFEDKIFANNLEDIFIWGNMGHLTNARSISVSDVIQVVDGNDNLKPGYYYCDIFGWSEDITDMFE